MSETLNEFYKNWLDSPSLMRAFKKIKNKSVLITGANGIIGYALVRLISLESSASIFCLTRHDIWPGLEHCGSNVYNIKNLENKNFDYVFHCATHSQPQKFIEDWRGTAEQSVSQLLDLLNRTNDKLVFSSSTEMYSGYSGLATENCVGTTMTSHPRAIYIESKKLGEAICFNSKKAIVNRIALAAGPYPKNDDSRLLFELIRRAKNEQKVQLRGGLKNLRQYQYTGSCAVKMFVTGLLGTELVYNNAGSEIVSIETLARLIAQISGVPYHEPDISEENTGAPINVTIDTLRFTSEFCDLENLDVGTKQLIQFLIEDIS